MTPWWWQGGSSGADLRDLEAVPRADFEGFVDENGVEKPTTPSLAFAAAASCRSSIRSRVVGVSLGRTPSCKSSIAWFRKGGTTLQAKLRPSDRVSWTPTIQGQVRCQLWASISSSVCARRHLRALAQMHEAREEELTEWRIANFKDAFWFIPSRACERTYFVGRLFNRYLVYFRTAQEPAGARISWAGVAGLVAGPPQNIFTYRSVATASTKKQGCPFTWTILWYHGHSQSQSQEC